MTTSRGITDTRVYDRDGVIDRYGIPPELVPDFIGLKGDTSDNIPGVPGIGDKTAADLLQRFGSLEQVLDSVDEISGAKRKENLINHADDARLSKHLATAKRDIPLDLDIAELVGRAPDRSRLRDVFREFELRDPLRRLEEALGSAEAAAPAPAAEQAIGGPAAQRLAQGRRTAQGRRGRGRGAPAGGSRGRAVRRERQRVALRGLRRRHQGGDRRPGAPVPRISSRRSGPGRSSPTTPSRWGSGRREPRPRHGGRRLPAGAGPARLPVPRAVRGARVRRRGRGRGRRRRGARRTHSPPGSARRSAAAG